MPVHVISFLILMPTFDDARRQDGHVRLYLVMTAQRLCCRYPTDVFLMSFLPRKYPCVFAPPKGIEKQRELRSKGLMQALPEDWPLVKSCTCPSLPPIFMLCSFPSKTSQMENAFPSVQFTGDMSRPATDISSFIQGCEGERNG